MTQSSEYITWIGLHQIDILPFASRAIEQCPYRHDLTAWQLAELVDKVERGKYIPVDVQDRVEGRKLWWLTRHVITEVRQVTYWPHRISQMTDPDVLWLRPFIELHHFEDTSICQRAAKMLGRWLRPDELVPFPLPGCLHDRCTCSYRTWSSREGPSAHPGWETP